MEGGDGKSGEIFENGKEKDSKIFKAAGIKFSLPNVSEIIHIWQVIKKVINLYFALYQTIIVVSFHTISSNHCQMNCLSGFRFAGKCIPLIAQ